MTFMKSDVVRDFFTDLIDESQVCTSSDILKMEERFLGYLWLRGMKIVPIEESAVKRCKCSEL